MTKHEEFVKKTAEATGFSEEDVEKTLQYFFGPLGLQKALSWLAPTLCISNIGKIFPMRARIKFCKQQVEANRRIKTIAYRNTQRKRRQNGYTTEQNKTRYLKKKENITGTESAR